MLPSTRGSTWLTTTFSIDRLVTDAVLCFVGGSLFFGYAVLRWAHLGFGPLDDSEIPRIVIVALTLIVISLQVFFSAFLLGVLEIPVKRMISAGAGRTEPHA
jgi:hypothetical protein